MTYLCVFGRVERDCCAHLTDRVVVSEKWTENSALRRNSCGLRGLLVCYLIDESGKGQEFLQRLTGTSYYGRIE